jgi:hypothetical protein
MNMSATIQRRKLTLSDLRPSQRVEHPPPKREKPKPAKAKVEAPPEPAKAMTLPRSVQHDADGFPCGWCFERYSWGFHRSMWHEHGVHLAVGDYTGIVQQGRIGTAEWLARNVWRVRLRSNGRTIIVGVREGEPVTVLPDENWRAHVRWVAALERYMPDRPISVKTSRKRRQRAARRAREQERHA